MTGPSRRTLLGTGVAAVAGIAAPAVARGQTRKWRMVTSWPKNLPGPGVTAQRLADRITALSGGRIAVELYAAGELVSGLEVLDAVAGDLAEIGHTASFFWTGKMPAAAYFTATPFGLTPLEHIAWIDHGGGQALWDELYAPFSVKPFMAGNSGMQMGGWLRREIETLDDMKGLKFRIPGLGGEVFEKLGATPVVIPPSEILTALQTGAIDGTEFLGPWSDRSAGFYKVAPYYYWPGFHEPNGTGEAIVNLAVWQELPDDLKAVVETACRAAQIWALSETEWRNSEALQALRDDGVTLRRWPDDVLAAARSASREVMERFASGSDIERRIHASHRAMLARAYDWSEISAKAFLGVRNPDAV